MIAHGDLSICHITPVSTVIITFTTLHNIIFISNNFVVYNVLQAGAQLSTEFFQCFCTLFFTELPQSTFCEV